MGEERRSSVLAARARLGLTGGALPVDSAATAHALPAAAYDARDEAAVVAWIRRHGDWVAVGVLLLVTALAAAERLAYDAQWMYRVDLLTAYLPWYDLAGDSLRSLDLPGWNPHTFSGTPLAGDPQSGWGYLPAMLWFVLLPAYPAFKALLVSQLLLAGIFTYLLARLVGMGPLGALTAGAIFTTGPFLQHNSYCCTIFPGVSTWLPMAFVGIELAVRAGTWPARIASWGLAGFAVSQMLAGWIGQGSYYGLLLLAAYVFYRTVVSPLHPWGIKERAFQLVLQGIGVFSLGFALGAAGLLPRLDVNRRSNLAGGYGEDATAGRRGWDLDLLVAEILNGEDLVRRYWHYLGGATLVLALMAIPLVRRRLAVPFFALYTLAILVMVSNETPFHRLLYLLPRFESLHEHTPHRMLGLVILGPAMLAGATIHTISARRGVSPWMLVLVFLPLVLIDSLRSYAIDNGREMDRAPLTAAILATLAAALGIALALPSVRQRLRVPAVVHYAIPVFLLALMLWDGAARFSLVTVRAARQYPLQEQTIAVNLTKSDPGGAGEFLQGELARSSEPFRYFGYDAVGLRVADPPEWASSTGASYQAQRDIPRVQNLLVSGRGIRLGLYDLQGYNPVQLARYVDVMEAINGGVEQNYHDANVHPSGVTSPLLDLLNVRYVVVPNDLPPGRPRPDLGTMTATYPEVFRNDAVRVLANVDVLPRAWAVHDVREVSKDESVALIADGSVDPRTTALVETTPPAVEPAPPGVAETVQVTDYEANRVRLLADLATAGMVVLSDVYDEGWNVYVDGERQEIYVADHLLRAVAVPAGSHAIEFRYEPLSLRAGLALTAAAALLILGCLAILGWRWWAGRAATPARGAGA